jgi:HK97 family phage major capsid protein
MFDIESWLASEVAVEFAEEEGAAFITGNGVKKPRGILGYTPVANANYAWGSVGFVASGAAGAFVAAPNGGDCLISLQHSLKSGYRNNGTFMMNDLTFEAVRKLKDSNGAYIWRPGIEAGSADTLLGKPVSVDDNMPDIAANSYSIAFGDFQRGYIITDRMGARVLRDPYTNKPFVHFYTTKRVGGGIQDFAAIKLLKFA